MVKMAIYTYIYMLVIVIHVYIYIGITCKVDLTNNNWDPTIGLRENDQQNGLLTKNDDPTGI